MIKFADISEIRTGYALRGALSDYVSGDVTVIQAKDIASDLGARNRPSIDFPGATRHLLKPGDILVSARGNLRAVVYTDTDSLAIASSSLLVIRPISQLFTSSYLVMFINSATGREALARRSSGGSIPSISIEDLAQLAVPELTINKQQQLSKAVRTLERLQYRIMEKQRLVESIRTNVINSTIKEATS